MKRQTHHRIAMAWTGTARRGMAYWTASAAMGLIGLLSMGQAWADATPGGPADPSGRWITASGNLEVDVAPCGKALCGTVTRVLANRSMSRDGADMEPVDKRPALGMTLLQDFVPEADQDDGAAPVSTSREWSGHIYNRENGKTYRCTMSVSTATNPRGELILHAYVGLPIFGKTQRWQRVEFAKPAADRTEPTASAAPSPRDR